MYLYRELNAQRKRAFQPVVTTCNTYAVALNLNVPAQVRNILDEKKKSKVLGNPLKKKTNWRAQQSLRTSVTSFEGCTW